MKLFGTMPDGTPVYCIPLRRGALSAEVLTYGGAIRSLKVPDRDGKPVDVVLGFDDLEGYLTHGCFFGAIIGPFGNRIGGARFSLNGREFPLAANDGKNHLHGGPLGFDKQVWQLGSAGTDFVTLTLHRPDLAGGYPGNMDVKVTYRLTDDALEIDYCATTDDDTLCNLTNHSYFNLDGHASGPVLAQTIQIDADRFTPTDPGSIPTGELADVTGTPMDLRKALPIGLHIDDDWDQLNWPGGYDHNFVLNGAWGTLRPIAEAKAAKTGIVMRVETDLPGVQFYAGNFIPNGLPGKGGAVYGKRHAFCLETQVFPDAPNKPDFPSALLTPEAPYRTKTVYRFSAE